ncbi:MAG: DUF4215 domain-containing protein, partial [Candidatus Uhrbacteria bacterium]|nr:DUF4215 domain-containing protein [Candidatus Uhrbacteria bacterium]
MGFSFGDVTLTASRFYRVLVSGGVSSTSGVPLIRTNYGSDFSWTFRVREDASLCTVERLELSPSEVTVHSVGAMTPFTAYAYGAADSCSTSGQLLSGAGFDWSWTNPILDNPDATSSYTVAEWYSSTLVDSDVSSIPEGCTSLCTAAGSEPEQAVCGDGIVEQDATTGAGEDCDGGEGCSSSCKFEGSDAAVFTCSSDSAVSCSGVSDTACDCVASTAGCGDAVIGSTEDCDDGNLVDGDGCSASCIAEGSTSVNALCGNDDIAYDATTFAGEECDDGNALSGDGCSRECLREGSSTQAQIGDAQCGDDATTEPYETCDDGNTTDGDGCSSSCLREGNVVDALTTTYCGNGVTDFNTTTFAGEECDGQTGCADDCVWAGSSTSYAAPSFCGDSVVGTGELAACEVGASGDENIDATQIAKVSDDASYEVSATTNTAGATITVGTSGLSVDADLTLMCVAESDADCSDPATYGVGDANCCYVRPSVTSMAPVGSNVCLNATVYAVFSEEMDTTTFIAAEAVSTTAADGTVTVTDVDRAQMYAKLNLVAGQSCPSTHTTVTQAPSSLALRVWNAVKAFFVGSPALADAGDCILPIASYAQTALASGGYKVSIRTTELMEANSSYTIVIQGDETVTDTSSAGVRSSHDVGMNGTETFDFTTGEEICTLD